MFDTVTFALLAHLLQRTTVVFELFEMEDFERDEVTHLPVGDIAIITGLVR